VEAVETCFMNFCDKKQQASNITILTNAIFKYHEDNTYPKVILNPNPLEEN